jgi:sugar lactone lactonase YvrE
LDNTVETPADNYGGKKLNSPNGVICSSAGDIYFTDDAVMEKLHAWAEGFNESISDTGKQQATTEESQSTDS